mgnify:CR=1 FL=1
MNRCISLGLISLLFSIGTMAQEPVESFGYRTMLKGLLSHSVSEISVDSLATNYAQFTILDARAQAEYKVSHLKGALHVGYDSFQLSRVAGIAKNDPIVVYCSVGYRSEKIAEKLQEAGYTQVFNLYGGIFEWLNQEKTIYTPQGGATLQIHPYNSIWGFWLNRGQKTYE